MRDMAQLGNIRRLFLLLLIILWEGPGCRGQRGEFLAMWRWWRGGWGDRIVVWLCGDLGIIGVTCNVLLDLGEN